MVEYAPNKSRANQAKHGLDFEQAQSLWKDPFRLEIKASSELEPASWLSANAKTSIGQQL